MSPVAIFLPLAAALIYVVGTLFIKRAFAAGATAAHVNVSANLAMGLIMQPLWLFGGVWPVWWQPLCCAALFFIGQCLTFVAITRGDVSVATPLMGTKLLFVSGFNVWLFGFQPTIGWWTSVILSAVAIGLVTMTPGHGKHRAIGTTAAFAVSAAAFFGLADILIQQWCTRATLANFLALMFTANALFSLVWHFLSSSKNPFPPAPARKSLATSSALLATQVLLLALALGAFNNATATNILYSSRSIWSVVLAWMAGASFGARDAEAGHRVMAIRLCGAVLLCVAIFLIVR